MKFTSKRLLAVLLTLSLVTPFLASCGKTELKYEFNISNVTSSGNPSSSGNPVVKSDFFAKDLCVAELKDKSLDSLSDSYINAGAAFNVTSGETLYSKNVYDRLYPASTTKILTAYIILKYGNLDDEVTVSKNATDLPSGASSASLRTGDRITVRDLLYGLMLVSGNDAAVALAEYMSGSVLEFSSLMNKEAKELGASNSHFVNPNGLHKDNHYTSVYDLYLIFNEAVKDDNFRRIVNTEEYTGRITRKDGEVVDIIYKSTNRFITGDSDYPASYTVIGGKTGTTYDAGNCLVLLVQNDVGEDIVLICLGADSRDHLYIFMDNLMNSIMEE